MVCFEETDYFKSVESSGEEYGVGSPSHRGGRRADEMRRNGGGNYK